MGNSGSNNNIRVPVIVLTGNHQRHRYYANHMSKHFDLRGVVSEAVRTPPSGQSQEEQADVRSHFEQRAEREAHYFARATEFEVPPGAMNVIERGTLNSDDVFDWIHQREPEYLLMYGCEIVRRRLLSTYRNRCINMHLGLSPYYRGSGTNFWPLVNREPELVGVTVHLATMVVDGGPVLKQVRPDVAIDDGAHDIGCKAIIKGTEAIPLTVTEYRAGLRKPVRQQANGREYRLQDFTPQALRQMWRHFETGMVEEYLANPSRADRYPIVV